MTIGYYQQKGSVVAAPPSTTLSVGVADTYLSTLLGGDLAFHLDVQNLTGFEDGASVSSFPTETGETASADNAGFEPKFNFNGINSHYALQIDQSSANTASVTPAANLVGATEYTVATVASVVATSSVGVIEYTRFNSGADTERIMQEFSSGNGSVSNRWIFNNGLTNQPYNFPSAATDVLMVSRRNAAGQLDFAAYDLDTLNGGFSTPSNEVAVGDMVFEAQPSLTFGDLLFGSTNTIYIGEHFFATRRMTDLEVIQYAAHARTKWG